jgi:P pilus assembly chaperone PapD
MNDLVTSPRSSRVWPIWAFLFVIGAAGFAAPSAVGGVLVAPTVVFLSEGTPTGELTIQNPATKPTEVTIFFSFGLPVSDSLGNVKIVLQDSAVTDPRSAKEWLKAFPKKFVLPALGSQVVRFRVQPPKDLADGEYWARVVVRSEEGQMSIPNAQETEGITTRLNMIMQTAVMLKYRKGPLTAELQVNDMWASYQNQKVAVMVDMTNKGSASYVGMLNCQVRDASNKEIYARSIQLAVYRDLTRRVELPLPAGDFEQPFKVDVSISTQGRNDIADEFIIPGNDITHTLVVQ